MLCSDVLSIVHCYRLHFEFLTFETNLRECYIDWVGRLDEDYHCCLETARRLQKFGIRPVARHYMILLELFEYMEDQ